MKKQINEKLNKLNKMCKNLNFELEEDEDCCQIINHSTVKGQEGTSFGVFYYSTIDAKEFDKESAYRECNAFLKGLIAGCSLLNEKSYHNFIASI